MTWNEADTRAKLIDPAIHKRGWTEDLIRREETAGTVEIIDGSPRRRSRGKIDCVLRVKVNVDTQPVALALIEAKKENLPATPRQLAETLKQQVQECHAVSSEQLSLAAETGADAEQAWFVDPVASYSITREVLADAELTANNLAYFGEPAYEYDIAQAIEDGYLAACEIQKGRVNLEDTGITKEEIIARNPVDAITGKPITAEQIEELYQRTEYEDRILLPDRVLALTYKHEDWINALPKQTAATIRAIAGQFERGGTDGLENQQIFHTQEVKAAGGLAALQTAGNPRDLLTETKTRMFAA